MFIITNNIIIKENFLLYQKIFFGILICDKIYIYSNYFVAVPFPFSTVLLPFSTLTVSVFDPYCSHYRFRYYYCSRSHYCPFYCLNENIILVERGKVIRTGTVIRTVMGTVMEIVIWTVMRTVMGMTMGTIREIGIGTGKDRELERYGSERINFLNWHIKKKH